METPPLTSSKVRNTDSTTRGANAFRRSNALSEILDEGAFPRMIDVVQLRQICSRGGFVFFYLPSGCSSLTLKSRYTFTASMATSEDVEVRP